MQELWIFIVIIIIIFIVFILYQSKKNNTSKKSINTNDINLEGINLENNNSNDISQDKIIRDGYDYMKTQKLIIAGLIRDRQDIIPHLIKKLESMGQFFKDYRILIVENDSRDKTRQLLIDWSKNNNKVILIDCENEGSCMLNLEQTKNHLPERKRIAKMAYLRNMYLDYVKKHYNDYDYLLVTDYDITGSFYMNGIANSFYHFSASQTENQNIDAIGANGIRKIHNYWIYYDAFPYIEIDEPHEWRTLEEYYQHDKKVYSQKPYNFGDPLHPVKSCFAGAVFYRINKITPTSEYNYSKTGYGCEHVYFNLNFKMYLNPSMIYHVIDH